MEKVLPNTSFWSPEDPPNWLKRNRKVLLFIFASLFAHVIVAGALREISRERQSELAKKLAEAAAKQTVQIELVAPEADKKAKAKEEQAKAQAEQQKPPPPTVKANRIVDLPEAPEEVPDKANYLAQRNMKADKETIAKKMGEAENRKLAGVLNGQNQPLAKPQEKIEAKAKVEQRDGSQGLAKSGQGDAAADNDKVLGGEALVADGNGVEMKSGPRNPAQGQRQGGGGQAGTPEVKGRDALLPTQQQLAKLIEPAQRNLLQVQHGDITLLNARSSEMAAYVIGRAKRIYSFLTINGPLLTIFFEDVQGLHFPVAIEADIDRDGRIQRLTTIASSGSTKIDRLVSEATRSGLLDNTPPPAEGFEETGSFKFRFALYGDHIEAGLP
jgi:outer membrane biosynthesis protein TonB